jgi:16S rRNA (cytosine967-C5)-methyltransferase
MPDNARNAALYALERCRRGGAWSPAAIDGAAEKFALDRRDTAFVSRLTLCALENFALCDHYIGAYCTLPVKRLEPAVLDILRLGVCQILFMDRVPDSAAVDTGVQLCRDAGYARAAGLVNAVLRRVAENKADLPAVPGAGTKVPDGTGKVGLIEVIRELDSHQPGGADGDIAVTGEVGIDLEEE